MCGCTCGAVEQVVGEPAVGTNTECTLDRRRLGHWTLVITELLKPGGDGWPTPKSVPGGNGLLENRPRPRDPVL